MKYINLKIIFKLIIICFILNSGSVIAQQEDNINNNLYDGVTINLTPSKPYEAKILLTKLYREINFFLLNEEINEKFLFKKDSVLIYLKSGISWELINKIPKNPPFFLLRLIFNKKNKKVKDRLEYLIFNSVCEQKPEIVKELIESFEIYRYYTSDSIEHTFYFKIEYSSSGEFIITPNGP